MKRSLVAGTAIIGAALFAASIKALGLASIQEAFVRMGWGFGGILILSGAREAVRTLAWTQTIEGPVRLSFGDAFRARLAGEALNALLPMGMLVGEPMKAEHVAHRLPFATALRALAVEFGFYGVSLVLLFGAGAAALFPSSAVLFFAAMAIMIVPLLRNGKGWTRILERMGASQDHVNPRRAWRLLVLEVTFQLFAVVEVYLTLALITPQHVAWSSALLLETVS